MEKSELQIIQACQNGDGEKFGLIYDRYVRKIYDFIYYKTHHKETAEDLTSTVFARALERIGSFDSGRGTMQAWLYRIARNLVIDHYRAKKNDTNIEDIWDLAGEEDLGRDIDTKEKLKQVEKYLSKFKPEQREIIIMRIWQEMSYAEIADVLGKTEASCKMVFSRAISQLRAEMPVLSFISLLLIRL